ncbi:helix-turn-helix domain-containing protein [Actinokineospora sp.]|uniref:helix-turn-helix domain-containing protein n=1 Tax=Actinokineospora sp. TaxID=1872133 RepID=UPI0040383B04
MATPTRAKKRLGQFLGELRNHAGKTLLDAARELKTSDSTVSRYESGDVLPVWSSVKALIDYYKADDEARLAAVRLWETADDEPAPVRLPLGTSRAFRRFVNAEREGTTERIIAPVVVPGLLQTERYVRAINANIPRYHNPDARIEGHVTSRLNRQRQLEGPDALVLHAVIDEAVIRREVGGRDVMHEQLARLLVLGARPNITVQVLLFGAGVYGTMSGPCMIIDFPEPDDLAGVYLEYPAGGAWVENDDDVRRFTTMFEDASAAALSPGDTADLIRQKMRAFENHDQPHYEVANE